MEASQARIGNYSGGMRRRLDIAASFIGHPAVLFLDEPSNGLDPHSRKRLWDIIRDRADDGATVLLTTQYMEEADALADSIVILARGQVIATGTPSQLKDDIGSRVAELTFADPDQVRHATAILTATGVQATAGESPEALEFALHQSSLPLLAILQRLDAEGIAASNVIVRRPTLDEAFLHLTGPSDGIPGHDPAEAMA